LDQVKFSFPKTVEWNLVLLDPDGKIITTEHTEGVLLNLANSALPAGMNILVAQQDSVPIREIPAVMQ